MLRTVAVRAGAGPVLVDRLWDRMSHNFDAFVARNYVPKAKAVYAYEYTAKATFERARAEGVAAILDLPSLDSRSFEALQRAEREKFPELKSASDRYFDAKFDKRQARREEEIRLADVIVTNSSLTRRSHIEAGAEANKIIAIPLAAPPAVEEANPSFESERPLEVIWAGSFIIRKGAHYFLDAWRQLKAAGAARASVYGAVGLPDSALKPIPEGITFRQTIPRTQLFSAFQASDALVFPTLSDGFGMVVTEAFACGLPVITTDQAGAADLVRNGVNGFVIPAGDAGALRDILQWCLDNRQTLRRMRHAALETAKSWQWPDYRRALITAVKDALHRAGFEAEFELAAADRLQ